MVIHKKSYTFDEISQIVDLKTKPVTFWCKHCDIIYKTTEKEKGKVISNAICFDCNAKMLKVKENNQQDKNQGGQV